MAVGILQLAVTHDTILLQLMNPVSTVYILLPHASMLRSRSGLMLPGLAPT